MSKNKESRGENVGGLQYSCQKKRMMELSDVDKHTGCWNWKLSLNDRGYGKVSVNLGYKKNKSEMAHRYSYMLFVGDIPCGYFVCHKCDNPSCINPEHLFVGTQLDNMRDKMKKGRHNFTKGEDHHSAKLTWKEVREIRENKYKLSRTELGRKYDTTRSNIRLIQEHINWQE